MADDFGDKSLKFIEWFKLQDGSSLSAKIALHDYRRRGGGRGVVATEDIEEDEALFTIPRGCILTQESSRVAAQGFPEDPWLRLILALIYEHLQGSTSKWKPYLDVLPLDTDFNTLMYWKDDELDQLQASAVRQKIGKDSADDLFKAELVPFIHRNAGHFYPENATRLSEEDMLALAHRMGSTIMAYAFDLEPSAGERVFDDEGFESDDEDVLPKGMLPMADMLNADAASNASRPIQRGEEILNDYGPLPRSDLLRRYGYITPKYAQYDVVEIPLGLIVRHVKAHAETQGLPSADIDERLGYLEDRELLDEGYDIERASLESPDANERVYIPEELLQLMRTLLVRDVSFKKLHKLSSDQSETLMAAIGAVSLGILQERLSQYQTLPDDDAAALTENTLSLRNRMAIEVRLGEKQLLQDAILLAQSWAGGNWSSQEDPASKRRRTS